MTLARESNSGSLESQPQSPGDRADPPDFVLQRTITDRGRLFEYGFCAVVTVAAISLSIFVAPDLTGFLGAALGVLMIAIAVVDARYFIIPDVLTAIAFGLGITQAGLAEGWAGVADAMLRAAVLALLFFAVRATYQRLRRRQGIGLGDVKLAAVAGAWLSWTMLPFAVEMAALAALSIYGLRWLVVGRAIRRITKVPFGLFLAPAIWICWLLQTFFSWSAMP
jgi:leader peptidase (prepilin peptidase) / N-methyltransferase